MNTEIQTSDAALVRDNGPERPLTDIQIIRSRLVNKGLVYFAILVPIALILSLARFFEHGWHPIYILHIVLTGVIISGAVFQNRLSYPIRATILLGVALIVGMVGLAVFGLVGGGSQALVVFAILAAIAFGTRAGLIACLIALGYIIAIGLAVWKGLITFSFDVNEYATSLSAWGVCLTIILLWVPPIIVSLGVIHETLSASLRVIHESHGKHRRLVNSLVDTFLYRRDPSGIITFVTKPVEHILGYSTKEFSTHFAQYLTEDLCNQEALERSEQSSKGIQQPPYELQVYHKDGNTQWFEVSETPVFDSEGQVIAVEGVAHDITQRKRVENELRESGERYQSLFEHASDAIFLMKDGVFIDCNPKTMALFGCSRANIIGVMPAEFSPKYQPDGSLSEAQSLKNIERALRGEPQFFEWQHKRCDGSVFDAEVSLNRLTLGGEEFLLAIVRDITERRRNEANLRRFAQVIDQASEIVVITDTRGNITYVNPAFEKVTGYSSQEAIGQNPRILKSGKMDDSVYQELWKTITSGKSWVGRLVNKKKDGTIYIEEAVISPLRSATGEVINFVAVKRDVTREVELEEQFIQSQKMEAVGQLAGGVAHDFNNLLQVMQGYGEMVLEESKGRAIHGDLQEVMKATERATTLVRQLLAFSRKQVLKFENINLSEVISDLAKMIHRVIGEHIAFNIQSEPGLKFIWADKGQIEQILMNLCVNARDAMPEGGTLTISTRNTVLDREFCKVNHWARPGRYVVMNVTDTGSGMDEETQKHIFEPFFTTKSSGKGTGLGLATVFGIVRQHNGFINVYSEVGIGTTFRIYIPMTEEADIEAADEDIVEPPGGNETILIADDDASVRRVAETMLQRSGYRVLVAGDGEEAIRVFDQHCDEIDLALLDVVMPKLGGKAVYNYIQAKGSKLPVLFASGYSSGGIHDNFILDEGMLLIQKPYRREELLKRIREVLDA